MPKGPPPDVVNHLIDVHTRNGTLDKILHSAIGDTIRPPAVQEAAYLNGHTPTYGDELWAYDGGTTVSLLADINAGPGSSQPGAWGGFIEFDGDLYFSAHDPVNGHEVRKLAPDGGLTTFDINTGVGWSYAGLYGGFAEFGGDLYFTAYDPDNGYELRKLSPDGMVSVIDINSGPGSSYAGEYSGFVEFGGDLYFNAYDPANGNELRKLSGVDGTVSLVADISIDWGSSNPGAVGGFVEFGGNLYFTAHDPDNGFELRKLAPDGSVSIIDINSGPGASYAGVYGGFVEFDGDLYFTAYDPVNGYELRKLSGSDGTVSLVADLNAASASSNPGQLGGFVEFKGDLYFSAYDSSHGYELRKLSGTDGSILVIDIVSGPDGSNAGINGFTVFDRDLYFTAWDPAIGYELRKLDGETGEITTFDLLPGPAGSSAEILGIVNGSLAIRAVYDRDGDGPAGASWTMLSTSGAPNYVTDFQVVDDGSGEFVPGTSFYVSDSFFIG